MQLDGPWKFDQAEVIDTQQVGILVRLQELSLEGAQLSCLSCVEIVCVACLILP